MDPVDNKTPSKSSMDRILWIVVVILLLMCLGLVYGLLSRKIERLVSESVKSAILDKQKEINRQSIEKSQTERLGELRPVFIEQIQTLGTQVLTLKQKIDEMSHQFPLMMQKDPVKKSGLSVQQTNMFISQKEFNDKMHGLYKQIKELSRQFETFKQETKTDSEKKTGQIKLMGNVLNAFLLQFKNYLRSYTQ